MIQRQVGLPAPSFTLGCVWQIKLVGKKRRKNLFSRSADAQGKAKEKMVFGAAGLFIRHALESNAVCSLSTQMGLFVFR
ncbi:hypothetical protein SAMN06265361_101193 [Laceyella tengchongensis]|uniref:Uncharacterized protein n=1 Tax=Laceyella tengchongensis TaxID=574699 RepID=A0AA45WIR0_9BACL|nr:hypothetical protein SAMN06265361_101193 [Laceyella tengchongensis]